MASVVNQVLSTPAGLQSSEPALPVELTANSFGSLEFTNTNEINEVAKSRNTSRDTIDQIQQRHFILPL